jgi:hypothetical protein
MNRTTYRAVAMVLNDRINELRENTYITVGQRTDRISECNLLMDNFSKVFAAENEFFNRQTFEREVQKFPSYYETVQQTPSDT